uniref:B30.2/SPRY domain-containing protein n=1 Tax=Gadus morhua TaxID=8049 RepID=A0A8C5CQS5_GADMO
MAELSGVLVRTAVGCVFGGSCVLPCRFQPNSGTILHWVKQWDGEDVRVHSWYRDQDQLVYQDPLYEGRTSLISGSDASLRLARVNLQDQGRYLCLASTSEDDRMTGLFEFLVLTRYHVVAAPVTKVDIVLPRPQLTWSISPRPSTVLQNTTEVHEDDRGLYDISGSLRTVYSDSLGLQLSLIVFLPSDACELTLDPNTAFRRLSLSEDSRKVTWGEEDQSYPDHPERFDYWDQVLCREGLPGRCYWEAEWGRRVYIGVAYRGIARRGMSSDGVLGMNNKSWSLECNDDDDATAYRAFHNGSRTVICPPPPRSNRVGVYLDRPAGSLSFYRVSPGGGGSSDTLTHIHTFQASFTQEVLLPGVGLRKSGSSVSL